MSSRSPQPYVLEGHQFEYVDGLPIRKCRRNGLNPAPGPNNEPNVARDSHLQIDGRVREPLTFCTPTAPDSQLQQNISPLLRLAHTAQAALLQAVAHESSPALVAVLQRVSKQCPDAIQAASNQTAGVSGVAAVQQAAVDMVLQQQHRLQTSLDQLNQQEGRVQSLTNEVSSLEQMTHSARQHVNGAAEDPNIAADQPAVHLEVRVLQHLFQHMELVKSKFETVSRELEVWFKDKISRKLPYTDDPVKALGMLNP